MGTIGMSKAQIAEEIARKEVKVAYWKEALTRGKATKNKYDIEVANNAIAQYKKEIAELKLAKAKAK